jgi:mannose-6-phosphate isomerase-like protein (cupin superfamily)
MSRERPIAKVSLLEKFGRFDEHWSPKIAAQLNDTHLKLVKVRGEFVWHQHAAEDELFLVVRGRLLIRLRPPHDDIELAEGELVVIPRGVEHQPFAAEECWIVLLEPIGTLNTGDATDARTRRELEWV